MTPIALILLAIVPQETVLTDRADVLMVEHYYDEQGRLVFDQLIVLEWNCHCERFDVVAWRLVKCRSMIPERDWERGGYVVRFMDGEQMRIIRAGSMREDWSQVDSELLWREVLPKESRRGLRSECRVMRVSQ